MRDWAVPSDGEVRVDMLTEVTVRDAPRADPNLTNSEHSCVTRLSFRRDAENR
jgi:hypothetical protein